MAEQLQLLADRDGALETDLTVRLARTEDAAIVASIVGPAFDLPQCGAELLAAVIEKFNGGPVGVENLAAAIGEERDTIEDVLEPYLIQQGFLMRTPRGRVATRASWRHFGLSIPEAAATVMQAELFDEPGD